MRENGAWKALLFCTLLLAIPAVAQDAASQGGEEPVYELGPGITPPRVTRQVNPEYKQDTRGFRISGAVLIGLVISSRGEPKDPRVIRSIEKEVDQSAVEAVMQWRFEPAKKGDKPVAVKVTVEIRFHDL